MNETDLELGEQIKAARVAAGLSKEAAARKANVTTTTLRRAESGERVQGHKLAAILTAVGIPAFHIGEDAAESAGQPEAQPFTLPLRIERGYTATVDFTRAVADEVPELAQRATRLMLDASALFAEAGDTVFRRGLEGGDGDADDTGGSAPTKQGDYELVADQDEHMDDEAEADETP